MFGPIDVVNHMTSKFEVPDFVCFTFALSCPFDNFIFKEKIGHTALDQINRDTSKSFLFSTPHKGPDHLNGNVK